MKVVNTEEKCVVDAADMQGSSTAHKGGKAESKVGAFFFVLNYYD